MSLVINIKTFIKDTFDLWTNVDWMPSYEVNKKPSPLGRNPRRLEATISL